MLLIIIVFIDLSNNKKNNKWFLYVHLYKLKQSYRQHFYLYVYSKSVERRIEPKLLMIRNFF